jgi:charged multivesicular body protein 2A
MALAALFGKSRTPAEQLRLHQRSLTRAIRDLDRERAKMEQQEKKLIMDIKKSAKAGQMVFQFSFFVVFTNSRQLFEKQ